MLPTKCLRCSLANCYYPITISKLINLLAFHSQITCYMLDKVTDNISLVLSAKSGQSDIRDGTYCSTKRKVHKSGKTLPNVPNMALVTSEGAKDLAIIFLMPSYPCGPILGLLHCLKQKLQVRTLRRSRLIV